MSLSRSEPVDQSPTACKQQGQAGRKFSIQRAAVLGAGAMGTRIAALLANAGLPVLLLDMVSGHGERSSLAVSAVRNLMSVKPPAFAAASVASRIATGNFEDDLHRLESCDWVIEAVAENLDIKRALLAKVHNHLHPNAILTTNTSGLPVAEVGAQLPEGRRAHWLGTHFFNPPRYMRLLELITTSETDPAVAAVIADFCDRRLGKDVVRANDVPNFIANRIGIFMMLNTFDLMQKYALTVEEIDLLTGPVIGWPKTATFRLADLIGIDVIGGTATNFLRSIHDERSDLKLPAVVEELIGRNWLGDKSKQGFYKKSRGLDGKEMRSVLDFESFGYRPTKEATFPSVGRANQIKPVAARLQILFAASDPPADRAAQFHQRLLSDLWLYSANRIGEVASSIVEVDRAMTAGYNWQLGPFAMWDAVGVPGTVAKMRQVGTAIPPAVEKLLASGGDSWYRAGGTEFFDVATESYRPILQNPDLVPVSHYRSVRSGCSAGILAENGSISLIDTGEGIGCFEFHTKMNALDCALVTFLRDQLEPGSEAGRNFDGFIITSDAVNFSVGANLAQLLSVIDAQDWPGAELFIRQFQAMTQAIKFSPLPVVSAPFGMCLGGGTEILMHSALRQPHLELYAGLVETGVGLIPGGGGCKEMLLRALAAADSVRHDVRGDSVEVVDALKSVFEAIVMAKVSTSAMDARPLRIVEDVDSISMNRARLVSDARAQAMRLVHAGYTAPMPRNDIPAPGETILANLKLGVYLAREGGYISDYDGIVAGHVAHVLAGGGVTASTPVSEQWLLDLEREAFLSLCGEPKTAERIRYTLKTGKPLRN